MKLAELTWPDLEQVSRDSVVVYPIAAFEQHGPHLPFITDTAEVAAIVDRLDAAIPDELVAEGLLVQTAISLISTTASCRKRI